MDRELRRRPRRNSDSSVMEVHEAEQKDRERRERRHREQRSRDNRSGSGSGHKDKDDRARRERDRKKNGAPLDIIDKLDVTGIYGSGRKYFPTLALFVAAISLYIPQCFITMVRLMPVIRTATRRTRGDSHLFMHSLLIPPTMLFPGLAR